MRNAKIICTIGPACDDEKMLSELITAGMNIARLNFSHGSHEEHLTRIKRIRKLSEKLNAPIAILQDLQGPKIRIGTFASSPIHLKQGDLFTITTKEIEGNEHIVSTSYKKLPSDVKVGDTILVNDGLIKLSVKERSSDSVFCEVVNGGGLYDRRGINMPGVKISEPSLTDKDKKDLEFGLKNGIDYVALSFVRDAESIKSIKSFMGASSVPVVAKLEKPEALENLDSIIELADVIMVARGDLGVEISSARVPVVQKQIIEACLLAGKPVITATQMLDSMMVNPVPTRAETSDVANAIFDGSDAVMLSGETAFGKYPLESVQLMDAIVKEAEKQRKYFRINRAAQEIEGVADFAESICYAACYASKEIEADYIVVLTESGRTARLMSNFRPEVPIMALTDNQKVYRQLSLYWGVTPNLIHKKIRLNDDLAELIGFFKSAKKIKKGDKLVVISGSKMTAGATNMLRLHIAQ
ncbi:MAG: pyruvate kinase [Calditrichaceae bacterium]|nr:pyruvate kinase [Calditrichaceae bacterium]MBN2708319.1 pyruvate kinase [Calditrichaceae bacterium]RQV97226.1 MAG: pyruvate kinase [Calditrichota bacterium]